LIEERLNRPFLLTFTKMAFVSGIPASKKSGISKKFDEIQGLFGKRNLCTSKIGFWRPNYKTPYFIHSDLNFKLSNKNIVVSTFKVLYK